MWIKRMLTARGIPFEELRHRTAYTAQEVAGYEHISGHRVAKVVVLLADGRFVEAILPASRRVDLGLMKDALNAKEVRLAGEHEMERVFTGVEVGAIPPLRHWEGVRVLLDRSLIVEGDIIFQAGTHEDAVRLNFRDWYDLVNPRIATISREPEMAMA
jgi:Ala-tRNA(Pro) deacylase